MLAFSRAGFIQQDGHHFPVKIEKMIEVEKDNELINAEYKITNLSDIPLKFKFAVEFNYGLQAGHAHDRYYYNKDGRLENAFLDSIGQLNSDRFIGLKDEYMKIDIQLSATDSDNIWRLPVETISLSEAGFEKVYQSSCILLIWYVELEKQFQFSLTQKTGTFKWRKEII